MKVFISGCAGFLASHLADAWLAKGAEVIGCDNFSTGDAENIPDGVVFFRGDCRDQHHMTNIMRGADLVYHCAAIACEGLSVFSPHLICDSILGSSASIFGAAIQNGVKRIIHCSSMARYGDVDAPFTEDQEPRPSDPYGVSKLASEEVLRILCDTHGVEYAIAIPHSIYGERQAIDPYRNVATIFVNRMLRGLPPVIYGDGEQQRCFSYISDVIPCLVEMGVSDDPEVVGGIINIGPDEESVTINELCKILMELCEFDGEPIHVPARPTEVKIATCSADKARRVLGYETKTNLRDGLVRLVSDIRKRGPRPFRYNLNVEIRNDKLPKTWAKGLL